MTHGIRRVDIQRWRGHAAAACNRMPAGDPEARPLRRPMRRMAGRHAPGCGQQQHADSPATAASPEAAHGWGGARLYASVAGLEVARHARNRAARARARHKRVQLAARLPRGRQRAHDTCTPYRERSALPAPQGQALPAAAAGPCLYRHSLWNTPPALKLRGEPRQGAHYWYW